MTHCNESRSLVWFGMAYPSGKSPQDILNMHAAGEFPVPVISICEKMGVGVVCDDNYRSKRSGHTELEGDKFLIVVNDKESPERKRFSIAHELAHTIFDEDYVRKHGTIDRDGDAADESYRVRERRANDFAANILMPEDEFIQIWQSFKNIKDVSEYFFVSKEAAKFRAMNLGLVTA